MSETCIIGRDLTGRVVAAFIETTRRSKMDLYIAGLNRAGLRLERVPANIARDAGWLQYERKRQA